MRRHFRRLMIPALVLAVPALLLLAGYAALRNVDLAAFRPEISAQVTAATGREFRIGEQLAFGFSRGLVIRANGLALGGPAWARHPDMLRVGEAQARVALWPLLRGRIEIEHVDLREVELFLETDASGRGNWQIAGDEDGDGSGMLEVRSLGIRSGSLNWLSADSAKPEGLNLSGIDIDVRLDGQTLSVQGKALLGGEKLELEGTASGAAGGPLALTATLGTDSGELQAEGALEGSDEGLRPALRMSTRGLDLQGIGRLAGHSLPAIPPLDAVFDLSRSGPHWRVENLLLEVGRSTLGGSLDLATDGSRPALAADLRAERIDLRELVPAADSGPTRAPDGLVLPPSLASALQSFDATLSLSAGDVALPAHGLRDLKLQGSLREDRLSLDALEASIAAGGTLSARAALDRRPRRPAWSARVEVSGFPAAELFPGDAAMVEAPADLSIELTTSGVSAAQMAANLAGEVRLVIGRGRAQLRAMDTLVGGLSTLTGQLLEAGADDTLLNCAIADFGIDRGVASARVLLVDSAASTVRGDGRIDLGREVVDLTFTPRPKKPTLTVAVPVHVRGALREPDFVPDRMASLTKLIGVAGAFVYPPAAIAALGDLGVAGNECRRLLQAADQPAPTPSAPARVIDGVGDAARKIGDGIKGLFGR